MGTLGRDDCSKSQIGSEVDDATFLSHMPNLRVLDLAGTSFEDPSGLKDAIRELVHLEKIGGYPGDAPSPMV